MALTKVIGNGLGAVTQDGAAIFNEGSADVDFRVESNGNANMLFIDGGNDKVGIGTASPDEVLHIHSDSITRLKITGSSGQGEDNGIKIFQNGVNTSIANGDNGYMRFYTNNTERMRITSAGNVGIGNINPEDFGSLVDNLVIGTTSGENGMTIASGTGNSGRIQFADNTSSPFRGAIEYSHGSDALMFYTSGSQWMRIRSGGAITAGTSQPNLVSAATLYQLSYSSASNWAFIYNDLRTGSGTSTVGKFYRNGSQVGSISSETNSVAYNTSSDYRLKENIDYTFDATTRLKKLKPARFNFITDADTTVDGFIAHEVQEIVPEAISGTKDAVDEDGNPVMQGIDQSKLVPLLVKTIQEAMTRIETLEAEVKALKG